MRLYRVRSFFRYLENNLSVSLLTVTVARNLVIVLYLTHWCVDLARGGVCLVRSCCCPRRDSLRAACTCVLTSVTRVLCVLNDRPLPRPAGWRVHSAFLRAQVATTPT